MRSAVKSAYRILPFKRPILHAVRSTLKIPERFYRHLHFEGPFTVVISNAAHFQMYHYGLRIENELFWAGYGKSWEAVSLQVWAVLAAQSNVILDVGANTGVYALAAQSVNADATVFAFEPIGRVFRKLVANINLNAFPIVAEMAAVSDRNGMATIYDTVDDHQYAASLEQGMIATPVVNRQVSTIRLDDYLGSRGIESVDLIKIDVEKHEPAVLQGLGGCLQDRPSLLIEVIDDAVAREVDKVIRPLGYDVLHIMEQSGLRRVAKIQAFGTDRNFLLCRPEVTRMLGSLILA